MERNADPSAEENLIGTAPRILASPMLRGAFHAHKRTEMVPGVETAASRLDTARRQRRLSAPSCRLRIALVKVS
jgi:hypothetical protein